MSAPYHLIFHADFLDPFGSKLGEGVLEITDETWYQLPQEIQEAQMQGMLSSRYAQPAYDGILHEPPFQVVLTAFEVNRDDDRES